MRFALCRHVFSSLSLSLGFDSGAEKHDSFARNLVRTRMHIIGRHSAAAFSRSVRLRESSSVTTARWNLVKLCYFYGKRIGSANIGVFFRENSVDLTEL